VTYRQDYELNCLGDMGKPTKTAVRVAGPQANMGTLDFQIQSRLLLSTPRRMFTWLRGYLNLEIW